MFDVIRKAAKAVQYLRLRRVNRTCVSEPEGNLGDAKDEASLQTSAEFVRTYSAAVDALTATTINAQAGLNWLSAQPPDLEQVLRTLNAVTNDGKRAGGNVVRLRTSMDRSLADDALDR
ncbi:hypothetical protein [Bradyrhizobium viridifuturi]|uniref:hypothetical protein n=1 Tax=Bradyrhizobium viridifuturi TaxID=1654716 RepID=UPI000FE13C98|nr:hypothetical protein [Bradyrhizobium viridifuturi]